MAGKSLTPFYIGLGVIAVAGGAFIWSKSASRQPPLTLQTIAPISVGPRGIALGPDSASMEILEFSDFQCPFCAQYATLQMPDIRQRLLSKGTVKWRFLHYPLEMHPNAPWAHLAASCANEQGRFWEMHDVIYGNQETWAASRNAKGLLDDYAQRAGLDVARYGSCMDERRTWGQVLADKALGDSLAAGMGTPTFFINGRQWMGNRSPTVDQLVAMADSIAAARAGAPAQGRRPAGR